MRNSFIDMVHDDDLNEHGVEVYKLQRHFVDDEMFLREVGTLGHLLIFSCSI